MATKICPNGHQYDASIYGDNCPFCPSGGRTRVHNFNDGDQTRVGAPTGSTEARTMYLGGQDKPTVPVQNPGGHTVIRKLGDTPDGNGSGRLLVGAFASFSDNPSGELYKIYEGRNVVGRDSACDIVFSGDEKMSGRHLLVLYVEAEGVVWAEDQASSNGTFVNGKFARGMVELHDGDVVEIGNTRMKFISLTESF